MGGPDTGKSSFARRLLAAAASEAVTAAYVDADIDQSICGPPTCVGLHWVRRPAEAADLSGPDALEFVGSITPQGVVLQQVVATAKMVALARMQAEWLHGN